MQVRVSYQHFLTLQAWSAKLGEISGWFLLANAPKLRHLFWLTQSKDNSGAVRYSDMSLLSDIETDSIHDLPQ